MVKCRVFFAVRTEFLKGQLPLELNKTSVYLQAVIILGFATLISGQYAPPVQTHPPIFPAQVYGPPELPAPAPVYGPPTPAPPFTPLVPPLTTGESNLVPPQFSPPAYVAVTQAQAGSFGGFAPSFAAPPSSQYGAPSFKK
jgi:hypothetical protein